MRMRMRFFQECALPGQSVLPVWQICMRDFRLRRRKMAAKWFTTENLIIKIENSPELYDKSLPGYKDHQRAHEIWSNIAKDFLGEKWNTLSQKGKDSKIALLRTRWKSVRDSYKKEIEKQYHESKSGSGSSQRTKYKYCGILEFLRKHHEPAETEDSLPPDPEEDDVEVPPTTTSDVEVEEDTTQDVDTATVEDSDSTTPDHTPHSPASSRTRTTVRSSRGVRVATQGRRIGRGMSRAEYDQKLISSIEKAVDHMEKREDEMKQLKEPCTQYLLSLVPLLQKVPPDKQWAARHAISETLGRFLLPESRADDNVHNYLQQPHLPASSQQYNAHPQLSYHMQRIYDPPHYPPMHMHNMPYGQQPHYSMPPPQRPDQGMRFQTSSMHSDSTVYTDLTSHSQPHTNAESGTHAYNQGPGSMCDLLSQHD
ncbi:uncharacterized protein [Hyperolius riggenbachi]|uniref:uncharacterized protein n=3 Tax=Hyperolius riggenbachi TaxID=752182 RepID=UPI0035A3A289